MTRPTCDPPPQSEREVASRIGQQAARLVPCVSLAVYLRDSASGLLRLQALVVPEAPVEVRPGYAGLLADSCLTPVPLTLSGDWGTEPRQWSGTGGELWLDVALGQAVLARFRLERDRRVGPRQIARLQRWAEAAGTEVAAWLGGLRGSEHVAG